MNEKLLKIIKHYGVLPQLKYFQSEVFELNEAIIKAERYEPNRDDTFAKTMCNTAYYVEHITEEIADVMVMIGQFVSYYGINNDDINKIMNEKIDRQLNRMKEEL